MKERKFFTKQNMVSLFIIFIMASSVIGFMWGRGEVETAKYNGYHFYKKGNVWASKTETGEVTFNYFPTEIENIEISKEIENKIIDTYEIDVTYDANSTEAETIALAQFGMMQSLSNIGLYVRTGAIKENKYNLTIITCSDATEKVPVIHFKKGNETRIYLEEECIIAEAAQPIDFLRIKDRLVYSIVGVMNG